MSRRRPKPRLRCTGCGRLSMLLSPAGHCGWCRYLIKFGSAVTDAKVKPPTVGTDDPLP